ncbi:hypothetical protein [Mycobacterium avium]
MSLRRAPDLMPDLMWQRVCSVVCRHYRQEVVCPHCRPPGPAWRMPPVPG